MIIKPGRHFFYYFLFYFYFLEIHEVRKGVWAFFLDCAFSDVDWVSRQTPITW